jgi:hypothetical protein
MKSFYGQHHDARPGGWSYNYSLLCRHLAVIIEWELLNIENGKRSGSPFAFHQSDFVTGTMISKLDGYNAMIPRECEVNVSEAGGSGSGRERTLNSGGWNDT